MLSTAGKLRNLTYVLKAGRYFVRQLLPLTNLHKNDKSKKRTQKVVKLGCEFHDNIAFWKWAIDQQLVGDRQSLRATFFTHVERPPARRYYSDAGLTEVSGFRPELRVYWRYNLDTNLSQLLKGQTVTSGQEAITNTYSNFVAW